MASWQRREAARATLNPSDRQTFDASPVSSMAAETLSWTLEPAPLRTLLQALAKETSPVYVVGGVPRDILLRRTRALRDLDVVVAHSAIPTARRVADRLGWAFYPLDEARDAARLVFSAGKEPLVCDIIRMRGGSIEADLQMRDFTVNTIALEPQGHTGFAVIDVTGAREDLKKGVIRRVNAASLAEDPVRLLRAVRFSVELGFPIEPATRDQMLRMPASITRVGDERVRDELWKTLAGPNPARAIDDMRLLGLLPYVLPEVAATDLVQQSAPHDRDVFRHTLATVEAATALREWLLARPRPEWVSESLASVLTPLQELMDVWYFYLRQQMAESVASGHTRAEWLVWHALFHDVGKPQTRSEEVKGDGVVRTHFYGHEAVGEELTGSRLESLRFSRVEIDRCMAVVRNHMRPHMLHDSFRGAQISRRARFRFFRDVGPRGSNRPLGVDVVLLAMADRMGIDAHIAQDAWHDYLVHMAQLLAFVYSEEGVDTPSRRPLVDGRLLMQSFHLAPGPALGALLEEIAEAQAAGEVQTTSEALALAARLVEEGKHGYT